MLPYLKQYTRIGCELSPMWAVLCWPHSGVNTLEGGRRHAVQLRIGGSRATVLFITHTVPLFLFTLSLFLRLLYVTFIRRAINCISSELLRLKKIVSGKENFILENGYWPHPFMNYETESCPRHID